MTMNEETKRLFWNTPVKFPIQQRGKLIRKIPMTHLYVDEFNKLWMAHVDEKGISWQYYGSVFISE